MSIITLTRAITAIALLSAPTVALAQVQLIPVVSGLSSPLFVGHAGDSRNRLFIVEQAGVVKVLQPGATAPTTFVDIRSRVLAGGERGLLGLAFHPQFESNGRLLLYYTRTGDGAVVIAEYAASAPGANTAGTAEQVLLTIPHPGFSNHNGGMLAFGPDGFLYAGVGDGGGANDPDNNAQNLDALLGKILRIDVDAGATYTSPASNPFFGAIDGRDEIFTYGMRNPWRFSFDRGTGQLWVGDVGQGAREEVDSPIQSGGNYGWPFFEGALCTGKGQNAGQCTNQGLLPPLFDYQHTGGRCSLTGGYVYRGLQGAVPAGTYLYGDYCSGEIFAWRDGTSSVLLDTAMQISSFGEDEQGEVYVVDLSGSVSRIAAGASSTRRAQPRPTRHAVPRP
jgi:glucose/arabinose dehydrogenase